MLSKRPLVLGGSLVLVSGLLAAPAAATTIEKSFELQSGGQLVVDSEVGGITVVGVERPGARVTVTSSRDDLESLVEFAFDAAGGKLTITGKRPGGRWLSWFDWGSKGRVQYRIEVPSATRLDLETAGGAIEVESIKGAARLDTSGGAIRVKRLGGNLDADTAGGSISVSEVEGDVKADTAGGGIDIEGVHGGVEADTSGGSIRIHGVTGDLAADTAGGSIAISAAGGRVSAETSGGSIDLELAPGNAHGGALSAAGGGIHVAVDPAVGLELDAQASGGRVRADLPLTLRGEVADSRLVATLGPGGELLTLRSSGGPIRIEALAPHP